MSLADDFLQQCETEKIHFARDEEGCITRVIKKLDISLLPVFTQLRDVDSPHLPKILGIECGADYIDVIEKYIEGNSLQYILDEFGPQTEVEVLACAQDIAKALCVMHALDPPLIHRDIKPLNIIRRHDGMYALIDFDAARFYSVDSSLDTQCVLTPGYAPPEQYGFAQSDERSDIFSLGTTLYEAYTGQRYKPNARFSGRLGRIVAKCTAFSPQNRYSTSNKLYKEIHRVRDGWPHPLWFAACGIITACSIALGFLC